VIVIHIIVMNVDGVVPCNDVMSILIVMVDVCVRCVEDVMSRGCFLSDVIEKVKAIVLFIFNEDVLVDLVF